MSILEKARELGALIAQSDEMVVLKAAETTMLHDPEAMAIIQEFQETRDKLLARREANEALTPEDEARIREVESKVESNQVIRAYLAAQEQLEKLLNQVHVAINQAMTGSDGCAPSSCSTCNGCS